MWHLTRRFVGSLWPAGPKQPDATWVQQILSPEELALWQQMTRVDRRHACGAARDVATRLGSAAERPVLAAALLHDVGKLDAHLGICGRVVATLCGRGGGKAFADAWATRSGFTRRVGLYLQHTELGAQRLTLANSDPLTVAWAREHHRPASEWSIPMTIALALKEADGN